MFEPVRGGTRGGQAEFKWSDVSADKDREHYLGHSINAPTGRWQKNKDVHWYSRDKNNTEDEKALEIKRIKQLEADALAVALGFEPAPKGQESGIKREDPDEDLQRAREKEEKHRRKVERKEEKAARKQAKLERKARERGEDPDPYYRRSRYRSRSRSPRRHRFSRSPYSRSGRNSSRKSLSLEPRPSHRLEQRTEHDYGVEERERERERDRRRWDMNVRRELPSRRP
ncbi:hypothetical protein Ac2012v2_002594 [Leucoagaricus gongylophorus]